MANVAIVVAPAFMAPFIAQFMPNVIAERLVTEHRVYGLVYVSGEVVEQEFHDVDGGLLTATKCFPTVEDAKAWVEQDTAQARLVAHGAVS